MICVGINEWIAVKDLRFFVCLEGEIAKNADNQLVIVSSGGGGEKPGFAQMGRELLTQQRIVLE
jgi:hypothetical protein